MLKLKREARDGDPLTGKVAKALTIVKDEPTSMSIKDILAKAKAVPLLPLAIGLKYTPIIKNALGVIPRYDKSDPTTYLYKAVYFNYQKPSIEADVMDVAITVRGDSVLLYLNRSCSPSGDLVKVAEEQVKPGMPVEKALGLILEYLKEQLNTYGPTYCRIGNYKTLQIRSPMVDRLKAYLQFNAENGVDLKVPDVAMAAVNALGSTQEFVSTYKDLVGESKPESPSQQKKINDAQPDAKVYKKVRLTDLVPKELTDRQRKNQLNKLISKGIGGGLDKKKNDPRVRKV